MDKNELEEIIKNLDVADTIKNLSNHLERHSCGGAKIHDMRQVMSKVNASLTYIKNKKNVSFHNISFQDYKKRLPDMYKDTINNVLLKAINEYEYKV